MENILGTKLADRYLIEELVGGRRHVQCLPGL